MNPLQVAIIQMDAQPAPTAERLQRAERLVNRAAQGGAQLAALPELFNTGYSYRAENYRLAEDLHGPTARWMQATAMKHGIHLAGTLLLRQADEIYNALLLFSPDGRMWRYDKLYPWGWERAYFRPGAGPVVAKTALGRIGMLICWDAGHPGLWRRYAGQVDLMLLCSCPPRVTNPVYHLPGYAPVPFDALGPLSAQIKDSELRVFGPMAAEQSAWLGVPLVATSACGSVRTAVPRGRASLLGLALGAPWLLKYLPAADRMEMACAMTPGSQALDASGRALATISQAAGETLALAEIQLATQRPIPNGPQPRAGLHWAAYLFADRYIPGLCRPVYHRNKAQAIADGEETE